MTTLAFSQLEPHAAGLRRLARALVHDAQAADDLVQDTWVQAMQSPPPRTEDLGAWLRTVLRRLAARARRAAARRQRREAVAAREESVEPDALRARQEVLARLVRAIGALPHPQQACVWLRYFDDLPARAVADRLGVPVATVHSRLGRAHAALRTELEERDGDRAWAGALLGAVGMRPARSALVAGGLVVTTMQKKLALGAVVLVACAVLGSRFVSPEPQPPGVIAPPEPHTLSQRPRHVDAGEPRTLVDASSPPAPEGLARFHHELEVQVLDLDGLPAAGRPIALAVPGRPANVAGHTDPSGRLRVAWDAAVPTMELLVGDAAGADLRLVQVTAGALRRVVLLEREPRVLHDVAMVLRVESDTSGGAGMGVRLLRRSRPLASMDVLADGRRRFVVGAVDQQEDAVVSLDDMEVFGEAPEGPAPAEAHVHGTVRDDRGRPVAVCTVAVLGPSGAVIDRTRTDVDGRFETRVLAGQYVVRAGGGRNGVAVRSVAVAGESPLADLVLDRGYELRGVLRDGDGHALAGWRIEVARDDESEPFTAVQVADEHGRFAIPNVPLAACEIRAYHPACQDLPAHEFQPQTPGADELDLRVPTADVRLGQVRLRAATADRRERPDAEFVLFDARSRRAMRIGGAEPPPQVALPGRALEVHAHAQGLDGRSVLSPPAVGTEAAVETIWLPDPARLRVRHAPGATLRLFRLGSDIEARVVDSDAPTGATDRAETLWLLTPGSYRLEADAQRYPLTLGVGEVRELDVGAR